MKKYFIINIIFLINISYIKNVIIIPFETFNPLLSKNQTFIELFKTATNKELIEILLTNLVYVNLNIGKNDIQNVPIFLNMKRQNFIITDNKNKNKEKNSNSISNTNLISNYNYLCRNFFIEKYYDSTKSMTYIFEKDCFDFNKIEAVIKNACGNETINLIRKNNIKEKNNEINVEFSIVFKEPKKADFKPGVLGLNHNNQFISTLKTYRKINNYDFYFKYVNIQEEKGEIIIGDLPHIYDGNNNDEKKLRSAKIIKELFSKWTMNIDIYISQENEKKDILEMEKPACFYIENYFIKGTYKYLDYIEKNFFKKYIDNQICEKDTYNNKANSELITYFICYAENEKTKKEIFDSFPSLIFYQMEMDYYFTLDAADLFTIIPDNKRILFNIYFIYNDDRWIFGKQFLKKYELIFNSDSNLISFYYKDYITTNKEKSFEDIKDKNTGKIVLIIILVIFAFALGIIFGKVLCSKYYRKLRANELEDNFSYISDENKDKKINEQKYEFKSKYYNLN